MSGMGDQTNQIILSNILLDTINPEAENVKWNVDSSTFTIYTMDHTGGALSGTFINAMHGSNIFLGTNNRATATLTSMQSLICGLDDSSFTLINANVDDATTLAFANDKYRDVSIINSGLGNTLPFINEVVNLTNGNFFISPNNTTQTGVGSNGFYLKDSRGSFLQCTVSSNGPNAIRLEDCSSVTIKDCTLTDNVGGSQAGVYASNSRVHMDTIAASGYANGIQLVNNSQTTGNNLTGANTTFGLDMLSGSSLTNTPTTNTISGAPLADVNVGSLGPQTWANIDLGAAASTNDFGTATPQYVSISH